jgi:plastocyanin
VTSLKSEHVAAAILLLGCASRTAWAADLTVNLTDIAGKPLPDAVVYAEAVGKQLPSPAHVPRAVIDQVNRRFVPAVTILRTGTEVSFPNSDNIRHSIYSFSQPKAFTTKLYSGRQATPVIFDKPGLVVLGCNIHDTMAAWVVVVDTPFFAKSGTDGVGVIKDIEPGVYRLSAWYPGPVFAPVVSEIRVGGEAVTQQVRINVSASPLQPAHP